jgi:hypothetical protein
VPAGLDFAIRHGVVRPPNGSSDEQRRTGRQRSVKHAWLMQEGYQTPTGTRCSSGPRRVRYDTLLDDRWLGLEA